MKQKINQSARQVAGNNMNYTVYETEKFSNRKKTNQKVEKIDALYCRLSRDDDQEGVSGSIKNQQAILEKYAADNGFDNPRVFIDDGWSGVSFARPAFTEIMELAEQGMIRTLIVKDHSRLGRNRLIVGQLMEEEFDRLGIRYIAIMDNIDTAKGVSDIVPMQDLFNEWHAKNTSQKVRNVFRNKGMSGLPLTTVVPYGYIKDPESKKTEIKWLIDEPAAEVVRRIFKMCIDGLGPTQIAKRLKVEKVMTPTEYWASTDRKTAHLTAKPYNWNPDTVSVILARQEYVGDTINFRSTTKSFKNKKKIDRPRDEWQIFKDTHPAIIDRETFALVQELRSHRVRPTRTGIISMFSGLIYCEDCGEKLYYSSTNAYKRDQAYFFCSTYRKDSSNCSAHFIREKAVYQMVLEALRRIFKMISIFEEEFVELQMRHYGSVRKNELQAKKRELAKAKARIKEIDRLIQKSYEDNANGKITDERYATLTASLETEQKSLKTAVPEMEAKLEQQVDKTEGLQHFVEKVKKITDLKELTPELVHEFIEKIVVFQPKYVDGQRVQVIDIYFNGVGIVEEMTPEQMEEAFQERLKAEENRTA